jgi:predicted nucleic acid-binding protein
LTALYLDSSAFLKTIIREPESSALRRFLRRKRSVLVSSALLRAEALRAVRHLPLEALERVRAALREVDLLEIDDRILETAGMVEPTILRTLEAFHLASALSIGEDLEAIITYDRRMQEGAAILGLRSESPH